MSLSKVASKCQICGVGKGIYSCPRCSRKYCSSYCYKSREHESCSEQFYKEWVEESLKEKHCDREQMLKMLENFETESAEAAEEMTLEDKFASLNFNDLDESEIWENLNEEERAKFKSFIGDEKNIESILPVKQPWWTSTSLNLVLDMDSDCNEIEDDISARPPFPLNIKNLSELTKAKPSSCIPFNLVNIVYAYSFLCRFYNCDLRDFLEEVVDLLLILSPVLSEDKNYTTLAESVQDTIRLINDQHLDVPLSFIKSIVNDVSNIMLGPNNARPSTFVLCALHDIKLILNELKEVYCSKTKKDKQMKKKISVTGKKIEYYMSWSSEYETMLSEISSELLLLMLPDLMPEETVCEEVIEKVNIGKPVIEEVN